MDPKVVAGASHSIPFSPKKCSFMFAKLEVSGIAQTFIETGVRLKELEELVETGRPLSAH